MNFKIKYLNKFHFTIYSSFSFLLCFVIGSILFFSYIFSQSLLVAVIGFWYIIIAAFTNVFLLIDEVLQTFNEKENKKIHINSAIL